MTKQDLRFLLKDKYGLTESEIQNPTLSAKMQADIEKLKSGYPLAYIIGWVEFLGCHIDLRYKPLIPRPETEFWAERAIEDIAGILKSNVKSYNSLKPPPHVSDTPLKRKVSLHASHRSKTPPPRPLRILDIFCGSGCIGIAVLKHLLPKHPNTHVTFTDISEIALKQTEFNLKINKIETKNYKIIKSDIFKNLVNKKDKPLEFDYILANPPYVDKKDPADESTKHEPKAALYPKGSGITVIKDFLNSCETRLSKGGKVYMEFGLNQKQDIEKLLKGTAYKFFTDQFGKERFVQLCYSKSW